MDINVYLYNSIPCKEKRKTIKQEKDLYFSENYLHYAKRLKIYAKSSHPFSCIFSSEIAYKYSMVSFEEKKIDILSGRLHLFL